MAYDALLITTFGGPNGMADVMPFLENVLRGRNVPRERMEEVAAHYRLFDGISPINAQNRALKRSLEERMRHHSPALPVYIGNRNWHPYLTDTVRQMAADGIRRAAAFVASGYGSYSGCRQYREAITKARESVGEQAPPIDKLRLFYNHPLFIQANADNLRTAFAHLPEAERANSLFLFTGHSIPVAMAATCRYEEQLREAARLTAAAVGHAGWRLVYQSRSGPPQQPWLEPDICDVIREQAKGGVRAMVIAPIGFTSDHVEVIYDLDTEAKALCEELGVRMIRAAAAGHHPAFVEMVHDLLAERNENRAVRPAIGHHGASHDICPDDCCCK